MSEIKAWMIEGEWRYPGYAEWHSSRGYLLSEEDAIIEKDRVERLLPEDCRRGYRVVPLVEKNEAVRELVNKQAEDDGLWFDAQTAAEAYLQQELRKLHAAIEEI